MHIAHANYFYMPFISSVIFECMAKFGRLSFTNKANGNTTWSYFQINNIIFPVECGPTTWRVFHEPRKRWSLGVEVGTLKLPISQQNYIIQPQVQKIAFDPRSDGGDVIVYPPLQSCLKFGMTVLLLFLHIMCKLWPHTWKDQVTDSPGQFEWPDLTSRVCNFETASEPE